MELTKEYFDEQLKKLATREDLYSGLETQTEALKKYTDKQTEVFARIVAETIAGPMEQHFSELKELIHIKEIVERHEREIARLKGLLQAT